MRITKLEPGYQNKIKVYLDEEYGFLLYTGDIRRYKLEEDMELSQDCYERIIEETVYRRARQKALAILKRMDRTEAELRMKLKQAEYTEEIVERTISYVNGFHYLDDIRYAKNFFQFKKNSKSSRLIKMELLQKGIARETIDAIMEEEPSNDEYAIQKAINKKVRGQEVFSAEEKRKLAAYLYRKGYSQELICKYIDFH